MNSKLIAYGIMGKTIIFGGGVPYANILLPRGGLGSVKRMVKVTGQSVKWVALKYTQIAVHNLLIELRK